LQKLQERDAQENEQMAQILESVLKKYPRNKCKTFADHQTFAVAELTTHSTEMHLTPDKFREMKSLLETKLRTILRIAEEEAVSQSQHASEHSQDDGDTTIAESFYENEHEQFDESFSAEQPISISSIPPASTKSLAVPKPRPASYKTARPVDLDLQDSTSTTAEDIDEGIPVKGLLVLDPSGHLGKYTGTICPHSGKPHGQGKLEYKGNKGIYQGEWNQGYWSGRGQQIKPNGDVYEGSFLDDVKHGVGVYRYRDNKRVFEGRYVMGQRVDGQMAYGDTSVYKGQWYDGKRHGRGQYRFSDGSTYKGEFVKDKIHGVGQLIWPDGSKYVGEWSQGNRHGLGKEYTAEGGLRFDGIWKDGQPIKN
jgi:hypothetical protein